MRVHHAKIVKEIASSYNMELIFNVPYSPQNNAIEHVWKLCKDNFKKLKLSELLQGNTID